MNNLSNMSGSDASKAASGLNIIAGIWVIISPFILNYTPMQMALWNNIVVLVFAWVRVANPGQYVALSWINFLLGIWLIIAPFVLTYTGSPVPVRNDVILGIIVGILGLWSALATPAAGRLAR